MVDEVTPGPTGPDPAVVPPPVAPDRLVLVAVVEPAGGVPGAGCAVEPPPPVRPGLPAGAWPGLSRWVGPATRAASDGAGSPVPGTPTLVTPETVDPQPAARSAANASVTAAGRRGMGHLPVICPGSSVPDAAWSAASGAVR